VLADAAPGNRRRRIAVRRFCRLVRVLVQKPYRQVDDRKI
jgi:hypothetical protein